MSASVGNRRRADLIRQSGGGRGGDPDADGRRGNAGWIGHANPARRGSPRDESRCRACAVVDLQFDVHCRPSWGRRSQRQTHRQPAGLGLRASPNRTTYVRRIKSAKRPLPGTHRRNLMVAMAQASMPTKQGMPRAAPRVRAMDNAGQRGLDRLRMSMWAGNDRNMGHVSRRSLRLSA